MAWIRTVEGGDAEGRLARLYRAVADPASGRVDGIMKVHSLHPRGLEAHLAVYRAAMRGTAGLPEVERELIALVVSGLNGCRY